MLGHGALVGGRMNPFDLITANLWKGAAALGGLTSIGLAIALYVADHERDHLRDQIQNPKTGYIAQLAVAHANEAGLQASIDSQNKAIDDLNAKSEMQIASLRGTIASYQSATASLNQRIGALNARPLAGNDVCARVQDADRRVLEFAK